MPAHHGLTVSAISSSAALAAGSRSLPDPGYKYLPLHSGGICLTQATMATAFLLLLGVTYNPAGEKATPSLLEVMRKWKNIPSAHLWVTSFISAQPQASDMRKKADAKGKDTHTHSGAGMATAPAPHTSGWSRTWDGDTVEQALLSSRPLVPPNSDATRPAHVSVHSPHPARGQQQRREELHLHSHP